ILASNINGMAAGVQVNFAAESHPSAVTAFLAGTEDIYLGEFGNQPLDPLVTPLYYFADTNGGVNKYMGYNNATVNSILNQALATANVTQRAQLESQANALVAQNGSFIQIAQFSVVLVTSNNVKILGYTALDNQGYLPSLVELAPA
ncbi:MAG: hypothetical protein ABSE82_16925, partial [Nitrososphaerales archaeon]